MLTEEIIYNPDATYTAEAYAAKLGITIRHLRRRIKKRQAPRPFYQGRVPCWRGSAIIAFENRKQQQALEAA